MLDNDMNRNGSQNPGGECDHPDYVEFLDRAKIAADEHRLSEAVYLYLTAYDRAQSPNPTISLPVTHPVIEGLRHAWSMACELDERSLAEYIFERIDEYLTADELSSYSSQLQDLAFHKLEEFGLSREDLEDVAEFISDGIAESSSSLGIPQGLSVTPVPGHNPSVPAQEDPSKTADNEDAAPDQISEGLTYASLVGYNAAIAQMHRRGFGLSHDAEFRSFITELNREHGIEGLPFYETLLFRAPVREDAARLMLATVGEMDVPTVRMRMDENAQGVPILCVLASPEFKPASNFAFESGSRGLLVLEDVDLWGLPLGSLSLEDLDSLSLAQLSRGARKALSLIRSAVFNPSVAVFASCSSDAIINDFIFDMLAPIEPIEIANPDVSERVALWSKLCSEHPSLRHLDRRDLVRLSANLSRYDLVMAATEAVEEAYRESINSRHYVSVTRDNMFEKLAAYQPLTSSEYHQLEDALVETLRSDLDEFDDRFHE